MTTFIRSPEYRKQRRTFFLTNKARVRKEVTGVVVASNAHAPGIQIIQPTVTTIILSGVLASSSAGTTGVTVTGGAQSGLAVFEDNFSSYANSADWRIDPNNWYSQLTNSSVQVIDTSITDPEVNSSQSLRLDYLPGICGAIALDLQVTTFQDGRVMADISPDLTELWVEMRIRFDDAWNTNDTNNCAEQESHALLALLVGNQGQSPLFQLRDGVTSDSFYSITAPPDNTGQTQAEHAQGSLSDSDNTWHVIRAHCKISEATKTTPDGLLSFEVDGERIVGNTTGFDGTDIITAAIDPLGSGETYDNFVRVVFCGDLKPLKGGPAQKLWISRIRIFEQDPGWLPTLPNLPEGSWQVLGDRPFDALGEPRAPGQPAMSEFAMGNADFIAGDGTNPKSSAGMMKINYPIGQVNGTGPINTSIVYTDISTSADPKQEFFFAYWFRISANFFGNSVNKIGFILNTRTNGSQVPATVPTVFGAGTGSLSLQVRLQSLLGDTIAGGDGARNLFANVTSAPITRDTWHFVEVYGRHNTVGSENGIIQAWLDGAKRLDYSNISWDDGSLGGSQNPRFDRLRINPTWGGGATPTNPVASFWHIDHLALQVR